MTLLARVESDLMEWPEPTPDDVIVECFPIDDRNWQVELMSGKAMICIAFEHPPSNPKVGDAWGAYRQRVQDHFADVIGEDDD